MSTMTVNISGMSCGHCVAAVQKALAALPGVTVHDVSIGSATVSIDESLSSRAAVDTAIDAAGYDVVTGRVLNVSATGDPATTTDA